MSTTIQQDAILGRLAVMAYDDEATVQSKLDNDSSLSGWVLYDKVDPRIEGNFAAYAFKGPNGEIVIAYRGTDGIGDHLGANKDILLGKWTQQLTMAGVYAKDVKDAAGSGANILVTGHSLGAAMAQIMSQAFGFDGATLDPLAAAKIIQTPEFKAMCEQYGLSSDGGLSFNGAGMPESFVNYAVVASLISGNTGAQLGRVQDIPGLEFSGLQAMISFLFFFVNPGLVFGGTVLQDQVANKHNAEQASQVLQMLARAADAGAEIFSGKVNLIQKTEEIVDDGIVTTQPVQGEFLVRSDTKELLGSIKFSGSNASDRLLEIRDADGNLKGTCHAGEDPASVICSMLDTVPTTGPTTNSFILTTNPDLATEQTEATDPTSTVSEDNSSLIDNGIYQVLGLGNVNTVTGNQQAANATLSDMWMPGANQVLEADLWANVRADYLDPQSLDYSGAYTNQQATGATLWTPVDPLVLDLNGDGVRLTSFGEAPVLFDIDHDGGAKEITGWVSGEDGIVVMDLNGNGKIDGIHETMSEYFGGTVGSDGEAGSKPYSDGFAALKSLDANGDNLFTSADTAWSSVKVWQDANHDGITDAGELKSFAELNITSINLSQTSQSGLVNGGNEVLATGSFVQNGQSKEAQAARFIANPTGNSVTLTANGATVSAQDGQSTYVSSVTTGEVIEVAAKGVKNAYGNSGDDTITGDAGANWLVGGQGSDTLTAGAGDDMLIIDAADLQQNIHAGDGFDMLQVVGSEGVTLNLAQAEVEVAVGGSGSDIFIGGGRSSVFVRAGDGDDIVIGGAANDALSGENGNDLIDGGAGNDLIRGGRGRDQLMGGAGDDLLEGGLDDDRLSGGAGNDVLKGGQGDDVLDGGEGTDIAEFSGSFSDYRITRLGDTSYRVVDSKSGRDGAEMLTNIEKLNFADVSAVDITLDNPMPVKDVLTIADRNGVKLIKASDLLANDRDWQGDTLHLTTISGLVGGTIAGSYNATTQEWTPTLTANGELQFTPDPNYTGVMSFKYKIADSDNTPGATAIQIGTTNAAEMRGQVYLKTPEMPTDDLFTDQWYLSDINVLPVWQDYTGKGVRIGQFEPGMPFSTGPEVFDYRHHDLQANADAAWLADPNADIAQSFSQHATLVAGVMVGARDGEGAVGVAYDAKLSGHYIQGTGLEVSALEQEITEALALFHDVGDKLLADDGEWRIAA